MLDDKTLKLVEKLEKTAADDYGTGTSQQKVKKQTVKQNYEGEGSGLGALIGAGAGALSKTHKPLSAGAGALLGALAGKYIGKHTKGKTTTKMQEGVIKKQERKKDSPANIPRLTDSKVLKLIESPKRD